MKVGVYIRVSTKEQSTDLQKEELNAYLKAHSWFEPVFFEEKVSGASMERVELARMLEEARLGKIKCVMVWKLDRLFRGMRDLVNTLYQLNQWGCGFLSLKDNVDMTTSAGKLLVHLLGAFAEFERDLIVSRVKAGLEAAKRKGKRLGRKPVRDIPKVRQLLKDGKTWREIQAELGMSKSSVARAAREIRAR